MSSENIDLPKDSNNIYLNDPIRSSLCQIFDVSVDSFIEKCQDLIVEELKVPSFSDFLSNNYKKCSCQCFYSKPTIIVCCEECQKAKLCCICLKCFLNGNHEGHHFRFTYSINCNCSCGNSLLWKKEGFCKEHSGEEPVVEDEFNDSFVKLCMIIFSVIFNKFTYLEQNCQDEFETVVSWMLKLVKVGDSMRRICVCSILNYDLTSMVLNSSFLSKNGISLFLDFLGNLTADSIFQKFFANSIVPNTTMLSNEILSLVWKKDANGEDQQIISMRKIIEFSYNAHSPLVLFNDANFDWGKCIIEIIKNLMEFYENCRSYRALTLSRIRDIILTLGIIANHNSIYFDKFIDDFSEILLCIERKNLQYREYRMKMDDKNMFLIGIHGICLALLLLIYEHNLILKGDKVVNDNPFKLLLMNDAFDPYESILFPDTLIPLFLPLHSLAWELIKNHENFKDFFISFVENNESQNFDIIAQKLSVLPMRLIAVSSLSSSNLFAKNTNSFINLSNGIRFDFNLVSTFLPAFSFLQTIFGLIHDKNEFIISMLHCYGFIDKYGREQNESSFAFLHDLCCLIFDRYCIINDVKTIAKLYCITKMKISPISSKKFPYFFFTFKKQDSCDFVNDLLKYSSRVSTATGVTFHLTNDLDWNVLLPWEEIPTLKTVLSNEISKNPDKLLPFPPFKSETYNLELKSILFTPMIFAIEFYFIFNFAENQNKSFLVHVNYALNLILQTRNLIEFQKLERNEIIYANSLIELGERLKDIDFNSFVYQKISFKESTPKSLIELMESFSLGIYTLKHMNIPYVVIENDNSLNKEKARNLRQSIINSFKEKQNKCNENIIHITTTPDEDDCCICHNDDYDSLLFYPVLSYPSMLLSLIQSRNHDKENPYKTISFRICTHPIHDECLNVHSKRCPIDRCHRNSLLPKMPESFDSDDEDVELASAHASVFSTFTFGTSFKIALISLSSEISLLEIRYRSNPNCLDDQRHNILFKNLYYVIYYSFDYKENIAIDESEPFQKLVNVLLRIKSYNKKMYAKIVSKILKSTPKEYAFEYLRRAALFQHYVFDDLVPKDESFHEWDDILSSRKLTKLYLNREIEYDDLPQFQFYKLPDNLFSLLLPPYNIDINSNNSLAICMLTGNIINLSGNNDEYIPLSDYIDIYFENSFVLLMHLNGQEATIPVFYLDSSKVRQNVFYRDDFDDTDIGFMKGDIGLHISNAWLDKLADILLSGSWVDETQPKSDQPFVPFFLVQQNL